MTVVVASPNALPLVSGNSALMKHVNSPMPIMSIPILDGAIPG
eukprot:CAMPEP_0198116152 /NCGR_PEP_ID=MMETSP1442-20131203/9791_1 /TAXON_ID= /ORGANISM="Craspedostauros australis, Strain CCMP3328" /LENGTH=42 /DNA_ID= /DNA_START= /DNA_END= /DNA_ORIENTATION=